MSDHAGLVAIADAITLSGKLLATAKRYEADKATEAAKYAADQALEIAKVNAEAAKHVALVNR